MKSVANLLQRKGGHVHTVDPAASIVAAATRMFEQGVGSLLVVDDGNPVGIVTRNDVVEAVAKRPDKIERAPVSEIMSTRLETTTSAADLLEIRDRMVERQIRHMPVIEDGRLVGLISLADLLFLELDEAHVMNKYLEDYLFGPYH